MLVSYVVTLFNKAHYLPYLCAGLAAQQGEFEREFIFVDDGSTDDTLAQVQALTAGWPGVTIITQANGGPSAALNRALAEVRGTVVKPVDCDDMLLPWATTTLLAALESTGAHMATARLGEQPTYGPQDPLADLPAIAPPTEPARRWDMLPASVRSCQTQPSLWLARADAVRQAGGSDPSIFVQDYSLELRLGALGPVAWQPGAVVRMGVDPGQLSNNQAQVLHDGNASLLRFLLARPELPGGLRRMGLRRAAGRAWRWAKRHEGAALLSAPHIAALRAQLGLLPLTPATAEQLCAPFRIGRKLRLPG